LVKISTFSSFTPPKTLNSGPKKKLIADFQIEFHGESEKNSVFVHGDFEKWPIRLLEKTTLKGIAE
jgi:hypothetical protein